MIRYKIILFLFFMLLCFSIQALHSVNLRAEEPNLSLSDIITRVEHRYAASSFSADFFQASTIKAMEITDTASGKAFFKHPGMMRWEYEKPDKQIIITDSNTIWIYRPGDNQVMIGESPSFFGNGKGASFLADMKLIRKKFSITLEKSDRKGHRVLKLVPREKKFDLAVIYLAISAATFNVDEITIYNSYEDETKIELSNIQFKKNLKDSMFSFQIPQGVEVMQLEE